MTIIFSIIFCLSLACGGAWAYYTQADAVGYVIGFAVSGFIGSSIITLVFCYLYFYQNESDQEKAQRLQQEVDALKTAQQKALPEQKEAGKAIKRIDP